MYPSIQFGTVLGADGAGNDSVASHVVEFEHRHMTIGTVIASSQANDPLLNQRVLLIPMRGWQSDPDAPEDP